MKKILLVFLVLIMNESLLLLAQVSTWQPTANFNYYMVSKDGLYGLTDTNYNMVVEPKYEKIQIFTPTMAIIKRNGKYGLMSYRGKEVVAPQFDQIDSLPKSRYYKILSGYRWGVMDSTGHILVAPLYPEIEVYNKDFFFAVSSGDLYYQINGLVNHSGDTIVPFMFGKIWNLNDTLFGVQKPEGAFSEHKYCGAYDIHGTMIVYPKYESVKQFSSKYLQLELYRSYTDSFFLLDAKGNRISYDEMGACGEGLCPAAVNLKFGYIDTMANTVIPFMYTDARPFYNGMAQVKHDRKWGCINRKNEVVIPFEFTEEGKKNDDGSITYRREDTLYLYGRSGLQLCVTTNYEMLSQRVWKNYRDDNYNYIMFADKGRLGLKTMNGKDTIVAPQYDIIYNYKDGMAKVKQDGKMSFIDKEGKLLFPFKYEYLGDLSNGMAVAVLNGKVGFISSKGVEVTPCIYEAATNFYGAYAYVKKADEILIIDITGSVAGKYTKKIDWDAEFYQWVKSSED